MLKFTLCLVISIQSASRLKKWYLMLPCLTLSIIKVWIRAKWSNPGKRVAPSPTSWCSSYWKGSLQITLDYDRQLLLYVFIIIIILLIWEFFQQAFADVFSTGVSDAKFPQVFRTLLRILADFNNAVVWMVSTRPLISKSSAPCTSPLVTVPKEPIIVDITVIFISYEITNWVLINSSSERHWVLKWREKKYPCIWSKVLF